MILVGLRIPVQHNKIDSMKGFLPPINLLVNPIKIDNLELKPFHSHLKFNQVIHHFGMLLNIFEEYLVKLNQYVK
jgi:hypothetical protein